MKGSQVSCPTISIIILNWNTWKETIECLESLFGIDYPNYEVIVLDNGSRNDSLQRLEDYCAGKQPVVSEYVEYSLSKKPIHVLKYSITELEAGGYPDKEGSFAKIRKDRRIKLVTSDRNLGFAMGNNVIIRYAMETTNPDYVLLLNNDTVVDSGFLTELVDASESDPSVGFAGPKTYYYERNGRRDVINFAGGRIIFWKGQGRHIGVNAVDSPEYDLLREVDYVEGSCLLAKTGMIREIDLMDSSFFAYWEETDWCTRARKAGYKSVYVPKAKIWHKIGASSEGNSRIYYMTRNMFWFVKRHSSRAQFISFMVYFVTFSFAFNSGVFLLCHRDKEELLAFYRGIKDGIFRFRPSRAPHTSSRKE
jgi:hypothetical protein